MTPEIFDQAKRRAVVLAVRAHPTWTLAELGEHLERGGARSAQLGEITVAELLAVDERESSISNAEDGGPPIDHGLLAWAQAATGDEFDALVLAVLRAAEGSVSAGYLRARVGGPRWKLQAACNRLVRAGEIRKTGRTSSTRYHLIGASS